MSQLRGSGPLQTATQTLQKRLDYNSPSLHDAIRNACHDVNMGPLPDLPKIGQVRCPGIDKKPSNTSGWINVKSDCAFIVDHSSGFTLTVFADKPRSHDEVRKFKRKQAQAEAMQQAKQDAARDATALTVATTWTEATAAPVSGYMASKGLTCVHGARWHERLHCWLVPLQDVHGKRWNIQRIYNRQGDNKRFMKGGRISGCFSLLGQLDINTSRILVCEGFATSASLRVETREVVACAMNAGNLQPACEAIRRAYPDINIIVCGDDDRAASVNVGATTTTAACLPSPTESVNRWDIHARKKGQRLKAGPICTEDTTRERDANPSAKTTEQAIKATTKSHNGRVLHG